MNKIRSANAWKSFQSVFFFMIFVFFIIGILTTYGLKKNEATHYLLSLITPVVCL